jgi:predicted patatin/cPLA2 family phospholipase
MRGSAINLLLCACLAGCASIRPEMGNPLAKPYGAVPLYTPAGEINRLPERATYQGGTDPLRNRNDGALEVLVVSGGGSSGAFGAGLLAGWSEAGTRPSFDIVTGISTGALMAPYAFLGAAYDDNLRRLYTETANADVFSSRGPLGIMLASLNDSSPLQARVHDMITDDLLDRIAAEHAKGRRLYIGTTDLDSGEAVTWDMGGIAASGQPNRRTRFAQILLASAAVPGLFDPVFIDGDDGKGARMHVDGGVKAPILLRDFMLTGQYRKKNVHVIINNCICLRNIKEPVDLQFKYITIKGIDEILRTFLYRSLETSYIMTRNAGANYHLQYIPDEATVTDFLNFNPAEMRELYAIGRKAGRTPAGWLRAPPRMQRFMNAPADSASGSASKSAS